MPISARAARLHSHGTSPTVETVDLPEPRADEVLVDLAYASINPVDTYAVLGRVDADVPLPRTLGREATGTVDGRPVLVFGHDVGRRRDGVWATAAVVPAAAVMDLPPTVDPAQAATLGVAGVTAWRTVHELARVTDNDRVLVLAAAGGVGATIVSLAVSAGATVWGQTGSEVKRDRLAALGVDRVVVCGADDLSDAAADLQPTVVFDPLGDGFTAAAVHVLEPKGRLVIFGTSAGPTGSLPLQVLYRKGLSVFGYGGLIEPEDRLAAALRSAVAALADGTLSVPIDSTVPLDDISEALDRLAARDVVGKLVVDLSS